MADRQDTESNQDLEPRPWWAGTGERLFNAVLVVAIGLPVAMVTGEPLWAGLVGCIGLVAFQAVYWRLYQGEKLTEVYDLGR